MKLSPREEKVLSYLTSTEDATIIPEGLTKEQYIDTCSKLENKGFIKVAYTEGHYFDDIKVLSKGEVYLDDLEQKRKMSSNIILSTFMKKYKFDQISPSHQYIKMNTWKNGEYGYIYDIHGNGELRFIGHDWNEERQAWICRVIGGFEECVPVIASGIIGYYISQYASGNRDSITIFETYTKKCEEDYITRHREDIDAWKRDLRKSFYTEACIEEEVLRIKESEQINEFLSDEDEAYLKDVISNYLEYLASKRAELKTDITIHDCLVDKIHKNEQLSRLHEKIDPIIHSETRGYAKRAMLYINAAQRYNVLITDCKPEIIEEEFKIKKSSYNKYKFGGPEDDYIKAEIQAAGKYIKTGSE